MEMAGLTLSPFFIEREDIIDDFRILETLLDSFSDDVRISTLREFVKLSKRKFVPFSVLKRLISSPMDLCFDSKFIKSLLEQRIVLN